MPLARQLAYLACSSHPVAVGNSWLHYRT